MYHSDAHFCTLTDVRRPNPTERKSKVLGKPLLSKEFIPIAQSGLGGFCSGTFLEIDDGLKDVACLAPGDRVRTSTRDLISVVKVVTVSASENWIELPVHAGDYPLITSTTQHMYCKHFLCAALFSQKDVVFLAGDVTGVGVRNFDGTQRDIYIPILEAPAMVSLNGYHFVLTSFLPLGTEEDLNRVSEISEEPSWSPHSDSYPQVQSLTRALLLPHDVRQLCQSGVIFRRVTQS